MERLTVEQEQKIIQAVYDTDLFLGNGGGRMVFDLPEDIAAALGLVGDYIVKIALGEKGLSQNILEIETYRDYHNSIALAEIPFYGQVIEIMEKVRTSFCHYIYDLIDCQEEEDGYFEPCDFYESLNEYYEGRSIDEDEMIDMAEDLSILINDLIEVNGFTADNAQVGLNKEGKFVAYDFGFTRELSCDEQCSDTRSYVEEECHRHTLINLILENIIDIRNVFEEDNVLFMEETENQFFDYIHDMDEEDICGYDDEGHKEESLPFSPRKTTEIVNIHPISDADFILSYCDIERDINKNFTDAFIIQDAGSFADIKPLYYQGAEFSIILQNVLTKWQNVSNIYYSI